jgi:hypothetical protein
LVNVVQAKDGVDDRVPVTVEMLDKAHLLQLHAS